MKKLYFLLASLLISTASLAQEINEFEPNPTGAGSDPANQSIELKGTPNASFSGWILSIESDSGSSAGTVDRATMVSGTFDANGLLVVSVPDLENPSFTVVLVSNFTGSAGSTDIDTDNDGTVDDTSTFGTIYDAIGIPDTSGDEATIYGVQLGGQDFKYTGDEPKLVFRDGATNNWFAVNDVTHDATDEVYSLLAVLVPNGDFSSNPAAGTSFGSANPSNPSLSKKETQIEGFNLYPNPASKGYVNISSNNNAEMTVNVFDVLGKQVLSQEVKNNRLDVTSLTPGVYILRATQDNAITTRKLVIK